MTQLSISELRVLKRMADAGMWRPASHGRPHFQARELSTNGRLLGGLYNRGFVRRFCESDDWRNRSGAPVMWTITDKGESVVAEESTS